jgi:hypothetical protein
MSRPAEKIALLEASLEKKENDIKVCPHEADIDLFLNVGFKVSSRICNDSVPGSRFIRESGVQIPCDPLKEVLRKGSCQPRMGLFTRGLGLFGLIG